MLLTAVVLAQQRTGCRQALGAVARMVVDKRIGHKQRLRDASLFLQRHDGDALRRARCLERYRLRREEQRAPVGRKDRDLAALVERQHGDERALVRVRAGQAAAVRLGLIGRNGEEYSLADFKH